MVTTDRAKPRNQKVPFSPTRIVEAGKGPVQSLAERIWEKLGNTSSTRSSVFLLLDLATVPSEAAGDPGLRLVSASDVRSSARYADGWYTRDAALARLEDGTQLFALHRGGLDLCFEWAGRGIVENQWMRLRMRLPEDVVYLHALYTPPHMRGQGLALRTVSGIIQHCKRAGDRWVFVGVEPGNTTSLRLHRRLGFREYQRIDHRRFFSANYYAVRAADSRGHRRWLGFSWGPDDLWRTFWSGQAPLISRGVPAAAPCDGTGLSPGELHRP